MSMSVPPDAAGSTRTSGGGWGLGSRATSFKTSTSTVGKAFSVNSSQQSFDLGLLKAGYLRKYNPGPLPRPQKRYVVLTEKRLHW